jgi:hypothetical protein
MRGRKILYRLLNSTEIIKRIINRDGQDEQDKGKSKKVKGKDENKSRRHCFFSFYPLPFTFLLLPFFYPDNLCPSLFESA